MTILLVTFLNKFLLKRGILTVYILKRDIESDTITKVLSRKKGVIFLIFNGKCPLLCDVFISRKKGERTTQKVTLCDTYIFINFFSQNYPLTL